jgi:urease accessory protein
VRARSSAVVGPGGVLGRVHCEPPLTLRRVHADDSWCGLCLVGSAAGPLAGDDLALDLHLEPAARGRLTATGASIAQGRDGPPATLRMSATLGAGAELDADPGPLIVCQGGRVDVAVTLDLAADATACWRELVVLGRSTDTDPGAATISWDVTRGGRPLLRQHTDLADPRLRTWPGMTGRRRVLAGALVTGPHVVARTVVASATAVAQRVDPTTVLVTVLGDSAAAARVELDALVDQVQASPGLPASSASTVPSMRP